MWASVFRYLILFAVSFLSGAGLAIYQARQFISKYTKPNTRANLIEEIRGK